MNQIVVISLFFEIMGRESDTAKDKEFHNMMIRCYCQNNGIPIDSVAIRSLTQNVSACLCRIVYVHLRSLFYDIGGFSNSKEKSKENAYYK